MLMTPSGKPASATSLPNSSRGVEASSLAFSTMVLPAARAGPIFTALRNIWLFHGMTAATTPRGSRSVKTNMSGLSMGSVSPLILSAAPPKKWKYSAIYLACHAVSLNILPVSRVSMRPRCSELAASRSPRRCSSLPRADGVMLAHSPLVCARCAATTARSMSASVASGMEAQASPVDGSTDGNDPPSEACTHWPSMSMLNCSKAMPRFLPAYGVVLSRFSS